MMTNTHAQKWRAAANGGFSSAALIVAGDTSKTIKAPKLITLAFRLQKLTIHVTTGSAGKTWTFVGSAATVITAALDVATAGSSFTFDFGPEGLALAVNESITTTISAAGSAGRVHVEGYYV